MRNVPKPSTSGITYQKGDKFSLSWSSFMLSFLVETGVLTAALSIFVPVLDKLNSLTYKKKNDTN